MLIFLFVCFFKYAYLAELSIYLKFIDKIKSKTEGPFLGAKSKIAVLFCFKPKKDLWALVCYMT